ncbi:MAG: pyrroline-5-carboxylate reductase [Chitinophagaceae bacterium]|nr:pyrroline-5-carboxylate reductase [Chitinophagaceae bacterium]
MNKKISIIGGGNLGTAIAHGLINSGFSQASNIMVTRRNVRTLAALEAKGVVVSDDNRAALDFADIQILAVKPFQVIQIIEELKDKLDPSRHLLISVITGITIENLLAAAGKKMSVIRAMPNTAIAIQESMTCLSAQGVKKEDIEFAGSMFSTLGQIVWIDEKLMEAATVLGACGTAYAMRYIRANIQGGIEIGFDATTASLIAAQTVKGAAELLLKNGSHPEQEIDKVTTPKGCTIAGLNEMEHQGFSSSLIKGIITSYDKIAKD